LNTIKRIIKAIYRFLGIGTRADFYTLRAELEELKLTLNIIQKYLAEPKGGSIPDEAVTKKRRYEEHWDHYSKWWDNSYSKKLPFLGDEWNTREFDRQIFQEFCKPYITKESEVMEIGCGGGKFSVMIAPFCKKLICSDISQQMLNRTSQRLSNFTNVQYLKLDGEDFKGVEDESLDFVFSYDVFVHLDVEDIFCYLRDMKRILKKGGRAAIHFANILSEEGWKKFVSEVEYSRQEPKPLGRFCYLTPEYANHMITKLGFRIIQNKDIGRDFMVVFSK